MRRHKLFHLLPCVGERVGKATALLSRGKDWVARMYARIYCIYHACMPAPLSSIMPGFCGRDTGPKALCPVSELTLQRRVRQHGGCVRIQNSVTYPRSTLLALCDTLPCVMASRYSPVTLALTGNEKRSQVMRELLCLG